MLKKLAASLAIVMVLGATAAFAGGGHCSGGGSASAAWSGAWLERTASGSLSVASVAPGSAAARAGIRAGDVVTAVNGHRVGEAGSCAGGGECNVGTAMTYTVQRGHATRAVRVKLEKMPASATQRFAHREAAFDPTLAAIVMPAAN